jgi:S-formylglutathione hydrolase FrmB
VFGSASSHSGVTDLAQWMEEAKDPEFKDIWPGGALPARDDLFKLAKPGMRRPHLFLDCGTSDFLLENNRAFRDLLVRRRIPHIYLEHPGGHNWDYWQDHIGDALDFHVGHFRKSKHL